MFLKSFIILSATSSTVLAGAYAWQRREVCLKMVSDSYGKCKGYFLSESPSVQVSDRVAIREQIREFGFPYDDKEPLVQVSDSVAIREFGFPDDDKEPSFQSTLLCEIREKQLALKPAGERNYKKLPSQKSPVELLMCEIKERKAVALKPAGERNYKKLPSQKKNPVDEYVSELRSKLQAPISTILKPVDERKYNKLPPPKKTAVELLMCEIKERKGVPLKPVKPLTEKLETGVGEYVNELPSKHQVPISTMKPANKRKHKKEKQKNKKNKNKKTKTKTKTSVELKNSHHQVKTNN